MAMTCLSGWYQSYRDRAKRRGRQKKAKAHLQRARSLYQQFVRPAELCFDVGANIGNRTEALVSLGARVIAVEPQPACVETLRNRFGPNPQVTIVDQAIDAQPGHSELHLCSSNTLSSMSPQWIAQARDNPHFHGCRWDQTVTVQTTTLDAMIASHGRPVFCKIDVEGFEPNVLGGLSQPIACLSFEFASDQPQRLDPCLDRISQLAPYRFNYSLGESMTLSLDPWVGLDELRSRLDKLDRHPPTGGDIYAKTTP